MKNNNEHDITEKLIMHDVACISAGFKGISESLYYEGLAESIANVHYHIRDKALLEEKNKLGVKVMVVYDDHGYFREDELENAVELQPDFVVFGGDHSPHTVEKIAEATIGLRKYALLGNHDSEFVEQTFNSIGAVNLHGRIVETDNGLIIGGMHGSHIYKEDRSRRTLLYQDESMEVAKGLIQQLRQRGTGMDIFFSHDKAFAKAYDPSLYYDDGCSHCGLLGNTWVVSYHDFYCESKPIQPVQYYIHGHLHKKYERVWANGQREKSIFGIQTLKL